MIIVYKGIRGPINTSTSFKYFCEQEPIPQNILLTVFN